MAADRHLLLGLLALQNGLIQPAHLVAAFHAWTGDRSRSLAGHLIALGHLGAAQRAVIEALAGLHVEAHGGDVERSLAALSGGPSIRRNLVGVADPDLAASLAVLAPDAHDRTGDHTPDPVPAHARVTLAETDAARPRPGRRRTGPPARSARRCLRAVNRPTGAGRTVIPHGDRVKTGRGPSPSGLARLPLVVGHRPMS